MTAARPALLGTAQEHAVGWLRRLIVSGELRPGQRVNQEDLAERIGLSVATVREALRTLEQEGQLTYRPRRGYLVTELRLADLEEIYALRRVLEERAARHALPLLDAAALERIEAEAGACERAGGGGRRGGRAGGQPALPLRDPRCAVPAARAAPDPAAVGLDRGLPGDVLQLARRAARVARRRTGGSSRRSAPRDADRLVDELDAHRERALAVLGAVLDPAA